MPKINLQATQQGDVYFAKCKVLHGGFDANGAWTAFFGPQGRAPSTWRHLIQDNYPD